MKSLSRSTVLVSFGCFFQRLLWALRGTCCLKSVFIILDAMKRVFRLRLTGYLFYTNGLQRCCQALLLTDHTFFLSIPVTFFFV